MFIDYLLIQPTIYFIVRRRVYVLSFNPSSAVDSIYLPGIARHSCFAFVRTARQVSETINWLTPINTRRVNDLIESLVGHSIDNLVIFAFNNIPILVNIVTLASIPIRARSIKFHIRVISSMFIYRDRKSVV